MKKVLKIVFSLLFIAVIMGFLLAVFYFKGLPSLVSNQKVIDWVQNSVKKSMNADLTIDNPVLRTDVVPEISLKVGKIELTKDENKLLDLSDLNFNISLKDIFKKKIILNNLTAQNLYADVDSLMTLSPQKETKQDKKNDWGFEIGDSVLGVENLQVLYSINPDTKIDLKGEHIGVDNTEKINKNFRIIN